MSVYIKLNFRFLSPPTPLIIYYMEKNLFEKKSGSVYQQFKTFKGCLTCWLSFYLRDVFNHKDTYVFMHFNSSFAIGVAKKVMYDWNSWQSYMYWGLRRLRRWVTSVGHLLEGHQKRINKLLPKCSTFEKEQIQQISQQSIAVLFTLNFILKGGN